MYNGRWKAGAVTGGLALRRRVISHWSLWGGSGRGRWGELAAAGRYLDLRPYPQ